MLSELFQLDDSSEEEGSEESLRSGGSEDSYSEDEDEEEVDDEEEDDSCSYSMPSKRPEDCKAVAVIKSVEELSVPEKYTSTHKIRVCLWSLCSRNWLKPYTGSVCILYLDLNNLY